MTACIVGWAHTPFGRLEGETLESLIVRVASEALADAGVGVDVSLVRGITLRVSLNSA